MENKNDFVKQSISNQPTDSSLIPKSKKQNIYKKLFFISFFVLVLIIISFIFILNNKKNQDTLVTTKTNSTKNEAITYKEFIRNNYTINLINKIENISNIYAISITHADLSSSNNLKYNLVAHYDNENTLILATISGPLDYRILDFSDNKIYFLINDDKSLIEVNYIDLNNLTTGTIELTGFNTIYKKSSIFCLPQGCNPYVTQIFVKDNILYYTEFHQSPDSSILKTYNINTNEIKTISNRNISWGDFYLDKTHDKLFYYSDGTVYISNLDGSNEISLGENSYSGSYFFSKAIYKNSPIFQTNCNQSEKNGVCDLNIFDYKKNTFIVIAKAIENFVVKSDSIIYKADDKDVIYSFYITR